MCEELSACAVMTDGAGSPFQQEVIKSQIMNAREGQDSMQGEEGGQRHGEKIGPDPLNDKGNQLIRGRREKVLFPPSARVSEGSRV